MKTSGSLETKQLGQDIGLHQDVSISVDSVGIIDEIAYQFVGGWTIYEPKQGHQFWEATVTVKNNGAETLSPQVRFELVDEAGEAHPNIIGSFQLAKNKMTTQQIYSGSTCQTFQQAEDFNPGETASMCLRFEVPEGSQPSKIVATKVTTPIKSVVVEL